MLPTRVDVSFFDYCLIEHLDCADSLTGGDVFSFAKRCGCPASGIAHTDLFSHIATLGIDPLDYFKRMADMNIFWEMNVSYDSTHHYREHEYVKRFLSDENQQDIVLFVYKLPEEVLCREILFLDGMQDYLVYHLGHHLLLTERMFEHFLYGTPSFGNEVHHLQLHLSASVSEIISHVHGMFLLLFRMHLHPVGESLPSLHLEEIRHLEVQMCRP